MDETLKAYLAGAMDSDGYFSIYRSTYAMRVRKDAMHPVYQEKLGIKQVTPCIPVLMKEHFGGSYFVSPPQTENSKPLHAYLAGCRVACRVCDALLPYLRIKRPQAQILLELRATHEPKMRTVAYWFKIEFPDWHLMELINSQEAAVLLGYRHTYSVKQAINNGTLLAIPCDKTRVPTTLPRIPRVLVERIAQTVGPAEVGKNAPAPELIAKRQALYEHVGRLNMIGVNGTALNFKIGPHAQK